MHVAGEGAVEVLVLVAAGVEGLGVEPPELRGSGEALGAVEEGEAVGGRGEGGVAEGPKLEGRRRAREGISGVVWCPAALKHQVGSDDSESEEAGVGLGLVRILDAIDKRAAVVFAEAPVHRYAEAVDHAEVHGTEISREGKYRQCKSEETNRRGLLSVRSAIHFAIAHFTVGDRKPLFVFLMRESTIRPGEDSEEGSAAVQLEMP